MYEVRGCLADSVQQWLLHHLPRQHLQQFGGLPELQLKLPDLLLTRRLHLLPHLPLPLPKPVLHLLPARDRLKLPERMRGLPRLPHLLPEHGVHILLEPEAAAGGQLRGHLRVEHLPLRGPVRGLPGALPDLRQQRSGLQLLQLGVEQPPAAQRAVPELLPLGVLPRGRPLLGLRDPLRHLLLEDHLPGLRHRPPAPGRLPLRLPQWLLSGRVVVPGLRRALHELFHQDCVLGL